ncbi:sterol desaturase family protein [Methyloglobulus sp.]|uniref:sterol desaturase family protein n=1 Tax=Methyloglobulus sp. TaxID=2518622 RepID=UPI003989D991
MLNTSLPTALFDSSFTVPSLFSVAMASFLLTLFFVLLLALECRFPREKLPANKLRVSYKTNLSLFVFNSMSLSLLSASTLLVLAEHYSNKWLSVYLSSPLWQVVLSFLLYDLSLYLWHRASHRFDFLWLFHRVHHSDPYLNVSTAFRLHLLDAFIITLVKAAYIVIFGFDKAVVLTNEAINTLFLMFHHSNITFKGERFLGYLIIVPYLHRVHHSTQRHEHDSNYGAVLSLWDRLFGTMAELEPKEVGINGEAPQDFIGLIKFGFTAKLPVLVQHLSMETMIAEAAYYKAEKRNFYPGHEIRDWLEAKREIIRQVYGDKAIGIRAGDNIPNFSKGGICC